MKHIASLARVSIGTVSHVINGSARVREPLRRRVLDAIRQLGYQPSQIARDLKRNQTNIVGMIVPDITNPFFPAVVRGAEDVAYHHSYRLVLCNADNDTDKERAYLQQLQAYRMAGLIIIPSENSEPRILKEIESSTPVVCLDRKPARWGSDTVTVDNAGGAASAAKHLLSLGHRTFGIITGNLKLAPAASRVEGFCTELRKAGIIIDPAYIQQGRFDRASGYEKMRFLLHLQPRPTAVFATNDLIVLGALSALREAALRCPEDMSLVGFDDLEFSELVNPPLTTVAQPGYQMGAKGATLLVRRLQGATDASQNIVLPTELKIRGSTAALRSARLRAAE